MAAAIACLAPAALHARITPAELHAAATPTSDPTWWKHAVIYEIYPRSFQDSNGDGIGDLDGIRERLTYLQRLGVDALWIAPLYPSPQVDFGYDVSNYTAVDPQYGTLADFDQLLATAKQHQIRIVLDMVLNHTSDMHAWFLESAGSRSNPKADWYCWSDGKPGTGPNEHMGPHGLVVPPNNWISLFGGSAWEWSPARQQFYYHKFYKQQPDLNWRNPAVEQAMFNVMRFWLDRGVAGFRLDAVPTLFEDVQLRDEPVAAPGRNAQGDPLLSDIYTNMLPEVHDVLRRLRVMVDGYPGDRVLIGETYLPNTAALEPWYGGASHDELQLPMDTLVGFHTEGGTINGPNVSLNLPHLRQTLTEMQTELGSNWPLLVFDNHDNPRSWDRFGDGVHDAERARIIATILLTSRATALMYYGEELGMTTHTPARVEDVRDPIGITGWPKEKGRDGVRTPMQWTSGPQAGFSTDPQTWLPVGSDYETINVATETADPRSLLQWHERLIELRRSNGTLRNGGTVMLDPTNPSVLSYLRTAPADSKPIFIALNITARPQRLRVDLKPTGIHTTAIRTLLTDADSLASATSLAEITLPPYASFVAEVQQQQRRAPAGVRGGDR
jgi:alpha-glucosidase